MKTRGIVSLVSLVILLFVPLMDVLFHKHGEEEIKSFLAKRGEFYALQDSVLEAGGGIQSAFIADVHFALQQANDFSDLAVAGFMREHARRECFIGGILYSIENSTFGPLYLFGYVACMFALGAVGLLSFFQPRLK